MVSIFRTLSCMVYRFNVGLELINYEIGLILLFFVSLKLNLKPRLKWC